MLSNHQTFNRRGTSGHYRNARMPNPNGPQAYDPPPKRVLHGQDLLPRFSPTAVFPTDPTDPTDTGDSGASSTSTPDQTDTPTATQSSSDPAATEDSTTASSNSPSATSDSSSDSSDSSTSATSSDTPSSTSAPSLTSSTLTSSANTLSSSSSLSSATPAYVLPTTSIPASTAFGVQPLSSSSASSATPSATPTTSGGTSTSVVVGGIAAGLVGLAGLIFAILFFLRRWRKRGQDELDFDPDAFKRQSAILVDDEPTPHSGGSEHHGGFNPRPPSMIERHMANRNHFDGAHAMPSLQQYHNVGASGAGAGVGANGYGNAYDHQLSRQPSFSPGQIMPSATSPAPSSTSTQFFTPYGQATPNGSVYNEQGQLNRQLSNGAAIYNENGQPSNAAQVARQNSIGGNAHYVDLDRSSVTPFQAAQYAEISRKLNEVPPPLRAVSEADEEPVSQASDGEMYAIQAGDAHTHLSIPVEGGNAYPESPFADPTKPAEAHQEPRALQNLDAQDVVAPPSPIYTLHSQKITHERAPSNVPSLPEIRVPDRTFSPTSYDFPQTPSARPTPSPFHTNFSIPSPPIREKHPQGLVPGAVESAESAPPPVPAPAQATVPDLAKTEITPKTERPTSTYTVYDEADAYGGF